jgi:uncharacterized protein YceK
MSYRTASLLGLAAVALSGGGCGTLANLGVNYAGNPGECRVYGGTRLYGEGIVHSVTTNSPPVTSDDKWRLSGRPGGGLCPWLDKASYVAQDAFGDAISAVLPVYFLVVDLPLTIVADTLTLPLTIEHAVRGKPPAPPPPEPAGSVEKPARDADTAAKPE